MRYLGTLFFAVALLCMATPAKADQIIQVNTCSDGTTRVGWNHAAATGAVSAGCVTTGTFPSNKGVLIGIHDASWHRLDHYPSSADDIHMNSKIEVDELNFVKTDGTKKSLPTF